MKRQTPTDEHQEHTDPLAEPEKLDLRSHDIAADKRAELLRLFPEAHTEGGRIDFDRLKMALGEALDVGKERYGLTWPGKADCFKAIQAPSLGTLRPCPEESVNFDTTENLFIEGDNLEVLKLLQKAYQGKVKMIYIDPPYNTGNDFIYPDDYAESLRTYLEYTGQVDSEGRRFSTNTDTDGRFHSKWLNMMYPRLYLARNLLREDGLIFVSIDDNEVKHLRSLMDEVFGENNFIGQICWKNVYGGGAKSKHIVPQHEYVIVYSRDKESVGVIELPPDPDSRKRYTEKNDKFPTRSLSDKVEIPIFRGSSDPSIT
jgi:adenine-specific DNA-methyltransferase